MDKASLARLLNYPTIWLEAELLTDELFGIQVPDFQKEYGGRIPEGGTEHWRYGAFHFWLSRNIGSQVLELLLDAASADPDQSMAGAAIKDIIQHPSSNRAILERAVEIISQSQHFYVSSVELEKAFAQKSQIKP